MYREIFYDSYFMYCLMFGFHIIAGILFTLWGIMLLRIFLRTKLISYFLGSLAIWLMMPLGFTSRIFVYEITYRVFFLPFLVLGCILGIIAIVWHIIKEDGGEEMLKERSSWIQRYIHGNVPIDDFRKYPPVTPVRKRLLKLIITSFLLLVVLLVMVFVNKISFMELHDFVVNLTIYCLAISTIIVFTLRFLKHLPKT